MATEDNETGFTPRTTVENSGTDLAAKINAVASQQKVRVVLDSATLHVPADDYEGVGWNSMGQAISGNYSINVVPPGNAVELDPREAEKIVARHGGRILAADEKFEPAPGTQPPYGFVGDH